MYHMLPFSYRPEVRANRSQHGQFQNQINEVVELVLRETEIVEIDNPAGKKIFGVMDTFFSYGLLTSDKSYWRCIQQFMPRAEKEMLTVELGKANSRYMSLGWLKTAFNKGTLHFQMLALTNRGNKPYLVKYYHKDSCMRNAGLLEAVTKMIGKLQHIQFAFYLFENQRSLRPMPAQAVVIETGTVQLSSRAAARQRKMTENEASIETILNVVPTEIPAILTATIDQDVMLDQLVMNRRNRLNSEHINAQKAIYEEEAVQEVPIEPVKEEKLEDVMVRTMSAAHMNLHNLNPLEEVLAHDLTEVEEPVYKLGEGEFQIQQGDILHLAINVFEQSSERVIETFKIILKYHSLNKEIRFFVMTNYNVYILRYEDPPPQATTSDRSTPIQGVYKAEVRIPHDRIGEVKIGSDFLSFMITSNENGYFTYEDDHEVEKKQEISYWAAIGSREAGTRLINALRNVTEHTSRSERSDIKFDDQVGYMCTLQPSLEKLLKKPTVIVSTALCYCFDHFTVDPPYVTVCGYLYRKSIKDGSWLNSHRVTSSEVEQRYCILTDMKMYNFLDSTCTETDLIIDFKNVGYCPQDTNSFTISCGSEEYEFESPDLAGFNKWMKTIYSVVDFKRNDIAASPCVTAFTENTIAMVQEGEKFWQDGFLRLLDEIDVTKIKSCYKIYRDEEVAPFRNEVNAFIVVATSGEHDKTFYFFVRYPSETDRLEKLFETQYQVKTTFIDEQAKKEDLGLDTYNVCCAFKNLWPTD